MRTFLSFMIILFQVGAIIYARFVPSRYFCWAPYDAINLYTLEVTVDGKKLSEEDIRKRYRFTNYGRDNRSIQHVINILKQYEKTYGKNDVTKITMRYSTNGIQKKPWAFNEK